MSSCGEAMIYAKTPGTYVMLAYTAHKTTVQPRGRGCLEVGLHPHGALLVNLLRHRADLKMLSAHIYKHSHPCNYVSLITNKHSTTTLCLELHRILPFYMFYYLKLLPDFREMKKCVLICFMSFYIFVNTCKLH